MTSSEPPVPTPGATSTGAGTTNPSDRVPVVFITGSGRSGSTLLERILGEVPGFVNVGELIGLFRWIAPADERCGCGERFSACPFWQQVGERAFGGWTPERIARIAQLQHQVARQRRLPQLLAPATMPAARREALREYQQDYRAVYHAVAEVAGARVVVDASKWPVQALALARSRELDVRVLHLVRDVRGVAYSWAKAGVARPHATGDRTEMEVHPVTRTATRWSAVQAEAELIGRVVEHYTRIRYEDVVTTPQDAVLDALRRLGVDGGLTEVPSLSGSTVTLGDSHGMGGNPGRFRTGPQQLRLDEKWRSAMSDRDRRLTTALAMPGLARYGYLAQR